MAFKSTTVLDGNLEAALCGMAGVALGNSDETEMPAVAALLADSNVLPNGKPESDTYQVALVHLGKTAERGSTNLQRSIVMEHVLLLPLTWDELMVRVCAAVRRSGSGWESGGVRFGQIRADFSSMEVTRGGQPVALTALEFKALAFLVDNPGRVISRDELLNEVWGYDNYPVTRTVDNLVLRLRRKLEPDPSRPVHFLTVHRVGYKFVP